jgi:hypothetical protein
LTPGQPTAQGSEIGSDLFLHVERMTGIEPELSAWELDCQASSDVRRCPLLAVAIVTRLVTRLLDEGPNWRWLACPDALGRRCTSTVAIQFTDDAMALVGHRHASIVNIQGHPACIVELMLSCSV